MNTRHYMVLVNIDEWMEEDEDCSFEAVSDAITESLRSAYIGVDAISEVADEEGIKRALADEV